MDLCSGPPFFIFISISMQWLEAKVAKVAAETESYAYTPLSVADLMSSSSSSSSLTFAWSEVGAGMDLASISSSSSLSARFPSVPAHALKPGRAYVFRLTVVDSSASSSSPVQYEAEFRVQVNSAPALGSCWLSPREGTALLTRFTIACSGWVDPDTDTDTAQDENAPLRYVYTALTSNSSSSSEGSVLMFPLSPLTSAAFMETVLPAGVRSVRVRIVDSLSAYSEVLLPVLVRVGNASSSSSSECASLCELANITSTHIASAQRQGNMLLACSLVQSVSAQLQHININMSSQVCSCQQLQQQQMTVQELSRSLLEVLRAAWLSRPHTVDALTLEALVRALASLSSATSTSSASASALEAELSGNMQALLKEVLAAFHHDAATAVTIPADIGLLSSPLLSSDVAQCVFCVCVCVFEQRRRWWRW